MLSVEEARQRRVCRLCEQPVFPNGTPEGQPMGWAHEFGKMVFPYQIILDFGREFAHAECLEKAAGGGAADGIANPAGDRADNPAGHSECPAGNCPGVENPQPTREREARP